MARTTGLPVRSRKHLLRRALGFHGHVRYLQHRNREGEKLYVEACRKGLEGLIATIQDLALRHANYGVTDRHYDTVGEALLWTLEKELGDKFTLSVRAAWLRAYTILAATMQGVK